MVLCRTRTVNTNNQVSIVNPFLFHLPITSFASAIKGLVRYLFNVVRVPASIIPLENVILIQTVIRVKKYFSIHSNLPSITINLHPLVLDPSKKVKGSTIHAIYRYSHRVKHH